MGGGDLLPDRSLEADAGCGFAHPAGDDDPRVGGVVLEDVPNALRGLIGGDRDDRQIDLLGQLGKRRDARRIIDGLFAALDHVESPRVKAALTNVA